MTKCGVKIQDSKGRWMDCPHPVVGTLKPMLPETQACGATPIDLCAEHFAFYAPRQAAHVARHNAA